MTGSSAQRSLYELADLATPMAVRAAATLGLADLADSWVPATELAAMTGTVAELLKELLDHLVTVGLFEARGDHYRATALGRQLSDDTPGGARADLDTNRYPGRLSLALIELQHSLTTGEAAYQRRYGRPFWDDLTVSPALRASFDASRSRRLPDQAAKIAHALDWSRFTDVVDVGGGDGTLLIEILRTHPLLRGRVLDLPPAAAAAADKLAASDVADRASAVAGNFFDSLPGGANAYVLSDVIRDWDNSNAVKVMDACARAAGHGSSVIVIEELRGADTAHALTLAVVTGGRERSADQLTALARACGLSLRSTAQVSGRRTALEFIVT
jgi:hypothetical protein